MIKRPLLIALIGYLIGIIWELYFHGNIAPIFLIILFIIYRKYILLKNKENIIYIILIIFIIFSYFRCNLIKNKYEYIYNNLINEKYFFGTIIDQLEDSENYNKYLIKIQNKSYKNIKIIILIQKKYQKNIKNGNLIKFEGEYIPLDVQRNYKGFNYSDYLKTQNIYGQIIIKNNQKINLIKENNINIFNTIINLIKEKINNNIELLFDKDEIGLLKGILLGDISDIDEEIKENFRNSGIYDILAVSGTHMVYIVIGINLLLDKIKISENKKIVIKIIVIFLFLEIAQSTVSIYRAVIMTYLNILSIIFRRKYDIKSSLYFTTLITLIYNPYILLSISFQLSFGAIVGIVYLNNYYLNLLNNIKINKKIVELLAIMLSVQTIIIPVMIINFHTISLMGFFSNIIISTLIGPTIIGGYFVVLISLFSIQLANIIKIPINLALNILLIFTNIFGKFPLSKIYIIRPKNYIFILYYFIIYLIKKYEINYKKIKINSKIFIKNMKKIKINSKKLILVILIFSIFFSYIKIDHNLKIFFIDVGQGDSCLLITPENKKILIDTGGTEYGSNYDIGEKILLPYLLNRGIKKLDYVMISHFDSDHCQGLIALFDVIKIENIIISKQIESENLDIIMEKIREKNINIVLVKKGDVINVDKYVDICVIYPGAGLEFNDLNNNSIVAKVVYNNFSILFTGDIESEAEKSILNQDVSNLKSTILKIAHHGSYTSTTDEFLKAVAPQIALIGAGKDNKFGHPNLSTIDKLDNLRC